MRGDRAAMVLALALSAAPAGAQEFAGMPGLSGELGAIQFQAAAFNASRKAPRPAPPPPPVEGYAVRGIDVSHYQGDIDWSRVKGQGLSFVYVKATEGDDTVDDQFAKNWAGAATAGLRRGAYHFYNFCKTGLDQAANFTKTVPVDADALPVTIDLERSGDCHQMPAKADFLKELAAFSQQITATYGKAPILYVTHQIYDTYLAGGDVQDPVWISDFDGATPTLSDGRAWAMWQYSYKGHVAGIPAAVDLDVFSGDAGQFAKLAVDDGTLLASR